MDTPFTTASESTEKKSDGMLE